MLKHAFRCLVAVALGATLLPAQGQTRHRPEFNLSVQDSNAEHCADLRAEAHGGELAQTAERFTLSRGQAPALEISAMDRSSIHVMGAAQEDYTVEVCKFAVARDGAAAGQLLSAVTVSRSAGRLSTSGPDNGEGEWAIYFLVHAPQDAALDLETRNGAISVRNLAGQVKVRAANGPIAVRDCAGRVEANAINGPIAFEGSGGDIHLQAQNGPISVKLSGDFWNGNQLEAHTNNGPISLKMPDSFRSGVRVETSGNSPMTCRAAACANASSDRANGMRVMQMNESEGAIHISTHNGPVSVGSDSKLARVM